MDEESALRWAQEESLKASKDAALPDLMLESELHRATQLSLRQSQLETERLRQQEAANQAELAKGVQASLEAATPPRPAPLHEPAKPESQQERRTLGRRRAGVQLKLRLGLLWPLCVVRMRVCACRLGPALSDYTRALGCGCVFPPNCLVLTLVFVFVLSWGTWGGMVEAEIGYIWVIMSRG